MDKETLDKRIEVYRKRWDAMSAYEKANLQHLAAKGLRRTADEGSQIEKNVLAALRKEGFIVHFHCESLIPNEKLQIDLFLPKLGIALELDGPSHFLPIFSEEALKKTMLSDAKKTGILISNGLKIIRVKLLSKNINKFKTNKLIQKLIVLLKDSMKLPSLTEIEV